MIKQIVNIVQFQQLYNILSEHKNLFTFKIVNFQNFSDYFLTNNPNEDIGINLIIIANKKNHKLFLDKEIANNNIIVLEGTPPIRLEKLLDKINILLIQQEYNIQSNVIIKEYRLNLNKRVIIKNNKELKLTEREIDIILFLTKCNKPQSINILQNKVWGYSQDLETHTVETHIYRLRKKFLDNFVDNNFIISSNNGYKI